MMMQALLYWVADLFDASIRASRYPSRPSGCKMSDHFPRRFGAFWHMFPHPCATATSPRDSIVRHLWCGSCQSILCTSTHPTQKGHWFSDGDRILSEGTMGELSRSNKTGKLKLDKTLVREVSLQAILTNFLEAPQPTVLADSKCDNRRCNGRRAASWMHSRDSSTSVSCQCEQSTANERNLFEGYLQWLTLA